MKTKSLLLIMALIVLCLVLVGCNNITTNENNNDKVVSGDIENTHSGDEVVVIESGDKVENNESGDKKVETKIIKLELYPNIAPESVENFIELANSGFYNGVIFHRLIPGFMAQGGDPAGNGSGGPNYSIYGEFSANGFENSLKHERGVLSMARSQENNSAGSQFFIMVAAADYLDGQYAGFGKVLEGMDVVDEIVNTEVIRRDIDEDLYNKVYSQVMTNGTVDKAIGEEYYKQQMEIDRPINPPVIKSIKVETFGVNYASPLKLTEETSGDVVKIKDKDAKRYNSIEKNPIVTIEIEK